MAVEVIMPALGMAQDSGLVVAWHKSPGDSVSEGEVLFEVETDKATMEVEAQGSGYLTDVRAKAGDDVPVGQPIALIAETREGGEIENVRQDTKPDEGSDQPVRSEQIETPTVKRQQKTTSSAGAVGQVAMGTGSRILASPKARRIALERGIELRDLLGAGVSQTVHADDVVEFAKGDRTPVAHHSLVAMVSDDDFMQTLSCLRTDDDNMTAGKFAATLAVGAARSAGFGNRIAISLERLGESSLTLIDPDIPWLDATGPQVPKVPDLILYDLTGTRLMAVHQFTTATPTLTLASGNGFISIRLDYERRTLGDSSAMTFISAFAERLETPLRQLL